MGTYNRFTEEAQKSIIVAQEEAKKLKHSYVGTEHLLLGLLGVEEGGAYEILKENGINLEQVLQETKKIVGVGEFETDIIGFTPRTKRVFELSFLEARNLNNQYVGTEHILLGLIEEGEGVAVVVLRKLGLDLEELFADIVDEMTERSPKTTSKINSKKKETPNLDKYGRDLTKTAIEGKVDPVIGRNKEIERIIQILSRRTKNNPVLIGEPGVGKTAIAEGLAQKIILGDVPDIIKDRTVITLDLASMLAGAKYRGEFEERFKGTINELIENPDIIVFLDELHTIVGAGAAEGAIDASNILKPVLARGELQLIGATTLDEYRKHIEKDSALERRLQPIMVEEPTVEDTVKILEGLRDKYEAHHNVEITDEAIEAATELSYRYISDRFLPDKAIDLIDEAASMIRMKSYTAPEELEKLKLELEDTNKEKDKAIDEQNFEKAAELRDREKKIEDELAKEKVRWEKATKATDMVVRYEDIAKIVSDWTGVPVQKMTEEESEKLLKLEEILHRKVIGQNQAVDAVSSAVRRARVGLKDPNKPVGSFIFVGPTGVGKTHLAKALSEVLFGDEHAMIRIDMSEYMEKHSVSRLIGSPPGYIGYDEGGQLTEAVRQKPYSVILFDEIEKAHPDVFNILLQILDDGRLTDSTGRTVDFKNTVIIMTSNVGDRSIKKQNTLGFATVEDIEKEEYVRMKETIMEELRRQFRPEFLNRIDDTIVFHSLEKEDVKSIVMIMLDELKNRLGKLEVNVDFSEDIIEYISQKGFDPEYGARPLERTITNMIENKLAEAILLDKVSKDDYIMIDYIDEDLVFKKKDREPIA